MRWEGVDTVCVCMGGVAECPPETLLYRGLRHPGPTLPVTLLIPRGSWGEGWAGVLGPWTSPTAEHPGSEASQTRDPALDRVGTDHAVPTPLQTVPFEPCEGRGGLASGRACRVHVGLLGRCDLNLGGGRACSGHLAEGRAPSGTACGHCFPLGMACSGTEAAPSMAQREGSSPARLPSRPQRRQLAPSVTGAALPHGSRSQGRGSGWPPVGVPGRLAWPPGSGARATLGGATRPRLLSQRMVRLPGGGGGVGEGWMALSRAWLCLFLSGDLVPLHL